MTAREKKEMRDQDVRALALPAAVLLMLLFGFMTALAEAVGCTP